MGPRSYVIERNLKAFEMDNGFRQLRGEFVDQCRIVTDEIEGFLNQVYDGNRNEAEAIQFIRREMHNLKGQGGVFGYPVISMIAHRLEDFLAKENALSISIINDVNIYLDHIRGIVSSEKLPTEAETTELLRSLPQTGFASCSKSEKQTIFEEVEIMVVTSSKLHLRRLEGAMSKPGWRLIAFDKTLDLLENALASPPNGVIVSGEMPLVSGIELVGVFQALDKLRSVPFAILTSRKRSDRRFEELPSTVEYISTGQDFSPDVERLIGVFSPVILKVPKKIHRVNAKSKPKRLELLIAEDNQINQILVQRFLEGQPYNITLVDNGLEALNLCRKRAFDVVLMDVMMPKMGGVEATESIRSLNKPWAKSMPIIALTADFSVKHQKIYLNAGMSDCIGKPVQPDELVSAIRKLTN